MLSDPDQVKQNLHQYVNSFSPNAQDIFARYKFAEQLDFLSAKGLLYMVLQEFAKFDLRPKVVSNADMGSAFEELIRKFSELSNETAGEHFTPREVIRLMVEILFYEDSEILAKPGTIRTLYDCCAGTGGMLSVSGEYLARMNPEADLKVYGQELNDESFAICKADMLIKGADVKNVICGNTLSEDGLPDKKFDYMLTNPPFGVEWKKVQKEVEAEHKKLGFAGRFGPGLPRVSDGSLLFLMHLLSKMRPVDEGGSRIGIVLNGSPLFTGGAGSGESDIRKYIIENDYLEAIIALPTDMFYNTGIATYVWILSNNKDPKRKGKIQLINAVELWKKMKKSLGSKRKELGEDDIERIVKIFGSFRQGELCKIVKNESFGYSTITVERPARDDKGEISLDKKGEPRPDSSLRDTENVPLIEDIEEYFRREVLPHVPDAWIDRSKTRVGYEIPFTRYFYKYTPPRPLEEIDRDLKAKTEKIMKLLGEISG
jgi:type I restriction enzyme M protein